MPRPPDRGGRWLGLSLLSFGLMLAALYLGQRLPALLYVGLVLGLFLLSFVALVVHHLYELVSLGQQIRRVAGKSRLGAAILLTMGVALALKLLKVW